MMPTPMSTPMPQGYVPAPGPTNPTHRPLLRRWLAGGVLLLLFLGGGAILATAVGGELGAAVAFQAALVAVVPLAVVLPAFLWVDRHEAEPVSSLVVAFLWGALVATAISLMLNSLVAAVVDAVGLDSQFITATFGAPVVEEVSKGAGILVVWALRRREFDGVLDGIVYGGIIAAGFAFGENILYLGSALLDGGVEGLALLFVLRGVMSPFAHPLFTVWTGMGIGVAAVGRSPLRFLAPVGGLAVAMLLHGLWNAGSSFGLVGWFGLYLLVQVPVFVGAVFFIVWIRRREQVTVARFLQGYVQQGVFAQQDLTMLGDARRRRAARDWAKGVGGRVGMEAMRGFQDAAVRLAYLNARHLRGHSGPDAEREERALVDSVFRARALFTGAVGRGR